MSRIQIAFPSVLCTIFISLAVGIAAGQTRPGSTTSPASAGTLKIVNGPSGGQIAYGSLTGQGTKTDAMIYLLREVHKYFGDKPQVGKFFQSHDGESLATFFTLNAKGGKQMAGLVLVTMHDKSAPQVAVLYDYADHFSSSEPALMKALSTAQQGAAAPSGAGGEPAAAQRPASAAPRSGPEQLNMVTGGDRSAVVGLPAGWRLTALYGGGQLTAEGPHGEMVELGILYQQIVDPTRNNRLTAGIPNYNNTPHLVCPMTRDLYSAWVSVSNQARRIKGLPQGAYTLISQKNLPGGQGAQILPVQAIYTVDFHDGVGPRKGSAGIFPYSPLGSPSWAMNVSASNIPIQYAEAEEATLLAVIHSYSQDANVIAREGRADLGRIQEDGRRAQIQVDAANARREASNQAYEAHNQQLNQNRSAFDQHNADIDWQSKINQDYILDRSVIRDTADTVHATTGNNLADALVRSNPNKLEYVPNQQLVQGVDY